MTVARPFACRTLDRALDGPRCCLDERHGLDPGPCHAMCGAPAPRAGRAGLVPETRGAARPALRGKTPELPPRALEPCLADLTAATPPAQRRS